MGINTKALRARIRSVDSTMHITKAMELVASSKIKRACIRMEESRFYRSVLLDAFADLAASDTKYSEAREDLPSLYVLVAGDRGLAGGYNANVFRLAASIGTQDYVVPIGRRASEYCARRRLVMLDGKSYSAETLTAAECMSFAVSAKAMYDARKIGAVYLVFTQFVSMLAQTAQTVRLLPLEKADVRERKTTASVLYEPGPEEVLAAVIPEYHAGVSYSAVCESLASELAARRSAMDTATKNAGAMIEDLNLKYNRARQSAITQEITEIIAGSEA